MLRQGGSPKATQLQVSIWADSSLFFAGPCGVSIWPLWSEHLRVEGGCACGSERLLAAKKEEASKGG